MVGRVAVQPGKRPEILERHFAAVEQTDVDGWVTFPHADAIRRYVQSMISLRTRERRRVPDDAGPVRAGSG